MKRPSSVTNEDIARWDENINNDPKLSRAISMFPMLKEVCFAGLWFAEELKKMGLSNEKITQLQFTAGRYSFGRDPWEAHQTVIDLYSKGEIKFEEPIDEE